MKICINCKKELPDDASWCPYCEKEQTEPVPARIPVRRRRIILFGGVTAAAAVIILFLVFLLQRPKVYEGGASVSYVMDGKPCEVFLTFMEGDVPTRNPVSSFANKLPAGEYSVVPSKLCVSCEGDPSAADRFADLLRDFTVTATPENSALPAVVGEISPGAENGSAAFLQTFVRYSSDTGTNKICWELTMKNKDIIRLYQTVTCMERPVLTYHWEETPLETTEDIEALIEKTAGEDPDAVLELFLPPVVYDKPLTMASRTAILHGSEENGQMTTFTDTMRIETRSPSPVSLYNIAFSGEGKTGIIATDSLFVFNCEFTGFDTGISALDGSWTYIDNCSFIRNKIGFLFDSARATSSSSDFPHNIFRENETAVKLKKVPGDMPILFTDCTFENNQTDIDDPKGLASIP